MVQAAPIDAQSPRGFETRFRCLSPAPDASSASSFVAPPDLAALRRIRGRVGDRRARPLVSNVSRCGVKGGIRPPRDQDLGLQCCRTRESTSPAIAHQINQQRSLSAAIISRFAGGGQPL
jgi:hypothetical protein